MTFTADITILGGLSVAVECTMQRAEPDVGIFSDWIEDFEITHVRRKSGGWKKIKRTKFAKALEQKCSVDEISDACERAGAI